MDSPGERTLTSGQGSRTKSGPRMPAICPPQRRNNGKVFCFPALPWAGEGQDMSQMALEGFTWTTSLYLEKRSPSCAWGFM